MTIQQTNKDRVAFKIMVAKIREYLKGIAVSQREKKEEMREGHREINKKYDWKLACKTGGIQGDIQSTKYEITATLNFYLELRGKTYRHAEGNEEYLNDYLYRDKIRQLKEEYEEVKKNLD